MKTIKLLLVFVFCFAVAVPAMAGKSGSGGSGNPAPLSEEMEAAPVEEFAIPEEIAVPAVECKACGLSDVFVPKKELGPTEGTLNHYVYKVEANGSEGMRAQVVNEEKEYALVMEKFRDGDGKMQTVKYCQGNEKYCKAIAGGRECDASTIPSELCYLKEEAAPSLDLGPTLAVEKPKVAMAVEEFAKAETIKHLK